MKPFVSKGFSLVELMIAITIAFIILLAISQVFVASNATQSTLVDATRLNEAGRFAISLIGNEARKAGLRNVWEPGSSATNFCASNTTQGGASIIGCNDQGNPLGQPPYTAFDPTTPSNLAVVPPTMTCGGNGNGQVANGSDVLRVRYRGDDTTGSSSVFDCQGNAVVRDALVEDTLYIASDTTTGEPALFCYSSNSNTALALIPGIESMQLLYGEDTDTDGTANRYVPWHLVSNPDNVVSIIASFVIRSPNAVANADISATPFDLFGSTYAASRVTNQDGGARFTPSTTPFVAGAGAPSTNTRLRTQISTEIAIKNYRDCN
jgi:type IV pilus assembly protein PilW